MLSEPIPRSLKPLLNRDTVAAREPFGAPPIFTARHQLRRRLRRSNHLLVLILAVTAPKS